MGLVEKIGAFVEQLKSIPNAINNLASAISSATDIERLRTAEQEKHYRIQRWIARGTWAAFIAASIYGGIAFCQWKEMRRQTFEANRAWISPFAAQPTADPQIKRLQAEVQYLNVGKSLAQYLNWQYKFAVVPTPEDHDWSKIKVVNSFCDKLMPDEKTGGVIYPGTSRTDAFISELVSDPPILVDDDLMQGKTTPVVYGCVAYRTMGEIGRSGFCFMFSRTSRESGPQGVSMQCRTGDRAE